MTEVDLRKKVIEAVCVIQELSGRPLPDQLSDALKPIGDFVGFDSVNAVEVAVQLSEIVGVEIDGNPFVDGYRPLKVEEVSKRIYRLANGNGTKRQ